jgi:hypothetical protein
VSIKYKHPKLTSVFIKRQPGVESFVYKLIWKGKIIADQKIFTDTNFVLR